MHSFLTKFHISAQGKVLQLFTKSGRDWTTGRGTSRTIQKLKMLYLGFYSLISYKITHITSRQCPTSMNQKWAGLDNRAWHLPYNSKTKTAITWLLFTHFLQNFTYQLRVKSYNYVPKVGRIGQ